MQSQDNTGGHSHSEADERRIRERALDGAIEASVPATDPPSSLPSPDEHSVVDEWSPEGSTVSQD